MVVKHFVLDEVRKMEYPTEVMVGDLRAMAEEIWRRIEENPDGYVMTMKEFAIFNYFRGHFKDPMRAYTAKSAVARFWDNTWGEEPTVCRPLELRCG